MHSCMLTHLASVLMILLMEISTHVYAQLIILIPGESNNLIATFQFYSAIMHVVKHSEKGICTQIPEGTFLQKHMWRKNNF